MNIFEGSRRIAKVAAGIWVIGFGIAALNVSPVVSVTYAIEGSTRPPTLATKCPDGSKPILVEGSTKKLIHVDVTACYLLDNPVSLLRDPNYVNADAATKQAIFDKQIAQDPDFINANTATKNAIRQRFGISSATRQKTNLEPNVFDQFDPDVYLAKKTADSDAYLADIETKASNFRIPEGDYPQIDSQWLPALGVALLPGLAWMLAGLAALWTFSAGLGWIVRGFMGIPRGQDTKTSA
ncbi:MAG: hypothetical protein NT064_04400 [Proteobacteria bacterium]|nr:hypothetical protein [Pseudomonadota bacterium]